MCVCVCVCMYVCLCVCVFVCACTILSYVPASVIGCYRTELVSDGE